MRHAITPTIPIPRTYAELRSGIVEVLITGRRKVEAAWVLTYHETGRLIHGHVSHHGSRADYGAKIIARLAEETKVSRRALYECVQFYREFPIVRPVAQLGWNQCRLLCQVSDADERASLIEELKRERLRTVDLKARVRAFNAAQRLAGDEARPTDSLPIAAAPLRLLKQKRGTPDLFRVVARGDALAVDVGFKLYHPLTTAAQRRLEAGAFVRWDDGEFLPAREATSADLFTYRATVRRVVDGDTLHVSVALPHYVMDEKIRLRGLDCPELDTAEGKAAKRYVERLLLDAGDVMLTTSKVDKYDRYLADVHLTTRSGETLFLNNALLREGHATPMGAEAMEEWTP